MSLKVFSFGEESRKKLKGVNPDLVKLAELALGYSEVDFRITEGLRSKNQQRELIKKGLSKTLKSKHLTGDAIDIALYPTDWTDWSKFVEVYNAFLKASEVTGIKFRWGGDWKMDGSFKEPKFLDGPHFELI